MIDARKCDMCSFRMAIRQPRLKVWAKGYPKEPHRHAVADSDLALCGQCEIDHAMIDQLLDAIDYGIDLMNQNDGAQRPHHGLYEVEYVPLGTYKFKREDYGNPLS